MKRLLIFLLLPLVAHADPGVSIPVGVAKTVSFTLRDEADVNRLINSVSFTTGDCASSACCKVSSDGGAVANCANQPVAVTNAGYKITVSAGEAAAGELMYVFKDAASSKRFADKALLVRTTSFFGTPEVALIDGAVTAAKFGANAITATAIADNAVTANKINTGAITNAKFAAGALDAAAIADNAITANKINTGAITNAKFASGAIDATAIASNAITDAKINTGAITAAKFAANAITNSVLATDSVGSGQLSSTAATEIANAVLAGSIGEVTAAPTTGAISLQNLIRYLYQFFHYRTECSGTTCTLYRGDDTTPRGSYSTTKSGTNVIVGRAQ